MNQPDLPTSWRRRAATEIRGRRSESVTTLPTKAVLLFIPLSITTASKETISEKRMNHQNSARVAVPLKSVYLLKQVLTDSIMRSPAKFFLSINAGLT